jgi:hypothetical protein
MQYSTANLAALFAVFPCSFQNRNEVSFIFQDASFYLFPSSWTIFVGYAYNVVDDSVDFLPVCGSDFYSCLLENLFEMSEVACHRDVPPELSVWAAL